MKFYRGLSLDKSEIDFIKEMGDCFYDKGAWLMKPTIEHHSLSIESVFQKLLSEPENIERNDKRNSSDLSKLGKYVCGCTIGPSIYSNDSHEKEESVIIEVEAELNQVFIDGRDFLYNVFPTLLNLPIISTKNLDILSQAFGNKFLQYLEKARQLGLNWKRIPRLVDYMCMDLEIIKAHHDNKSILLKGRASTVFASAFAIIGGIRPEMIVEIKKSEPIGRNTNIAIIMDDYKFKETISFNLL